MKTLIVVLLFAFTEAGLINTNCVNFRNTNYEKEVIKYDIKSPYQLTIDHYMNTLFFSFTARKDEMFKLSYLSLKSGEYGVVSGIHGGFATAVDNKNQIVYMGGEDGVYQFNYATKTAKNLHLRDMANIWQMFYKDNLYFTTYPEETAYVYRQKAVFEIPEISNVKTMLVAVNNAGNFVYTNSSGLFVFNQHSRVTVQLDDAVVNGISPDIDGNLYYSTPSGVYYINENTKGVEELFKQDNVYGVAIDGSGSIIYATDDSIVRLKAMKGECYNEKLWKSNVA